jgi:hypothetical protein
LALFYDLNEIKLILNLIIIIVAFFLGEGRNDKFLSNSTAFIGSNQIASSIFVFTSYAGGYLGKLGIQLGCCLLFGIILRNCLDGKEDYEVAINRNYASVDNEKINE